MLKKTQLAIFAAMVMTCSVSYGQVFTIISPESLGFSAGDSVDGTFGIGDQFGLSASAIELMITDGNVEPGSDQFWAVSNSETARFQITSDIPLLGLIQHGPVLGSQSAQSGPGVSDGFTAAEGQDWTLITDLDNDYLGSVNGSTYDVEYIGPDGGIQSNSSAFRWTSNQASTSFRYNVFSNNTLELVNNYSIGFNDPSANAVPEPSAAVVIAFASTLFLMRRKRS